MSWLEEALNLENRRKLYAYISQHPGTFIREMEREIGMPPGLLSYHLLQLERFDLIRSEDDGYRRAYFVASGFAFKDRKSIAMLRRESPRSIVLLLLQGEKSFQELQHGLQVSKSTLSHHLKKLVTAEMITSTRREREFYYALKDQEHITNLLILMKDSLNEDAVKRFADIWSKLGTG